MTPLRFIAIAAALCAVVGVAGFALFRISNRPKSTPLVSANNGKPPVPLPKDAIVLTASDGAEVEAPFLIHDEAGAVGGIAAFQPKGTRTEEHKGKVKFSALASEAGDYMGWVHGKWRDTCSNSCGLKANAGTEIVAGNDDVFNVWHWVPAGKHKLEKGANAIAIVEREDGIYVDQVLFTKDAAYVPTGAISTAGVLRDIRRFADTFTRSPGHGNEGWEFEGKGKFDIAFSFDPNRIPNQYALSGDATAGPCYAYVKSAPWYGAKVSFSFMPTSDGKYGCVLDNNGASQMTIGFIIENEKNTTFLETNHLSRPPDQTLALRKNQWHRVVVEHWAWVNRMFLDGKEVWSDYCMTTTKAGKAGLFVEKGSAVFDDFEIEEIPWMADDGDKFKIDWTLSEGANWYRSDEETDRKMTGDSGSIKAGIGGLPLEEIVLEEHRDWKGINEKLPTPLCGKNQCAVNAPGLTRVDDIVDDRARVYLLPASADGSCTHATFTAANPDTAFRRVALRFGRHTPPIHNIGPYTFTAREIEDPSDYLDFTEEEYKQMSRSPDAAKLQRHAKLKPIIGNGTEDDEGPWLYMGGSWNIDVREGCLKGRGSNSQLRHTQEISNDMEMRFKIRLNDATTTAEVELYASAEPGLRVQFTPPAPPSAKPAPLPPGVAMRLDVNNDKQWHEVSLRVDGSKLSAKLDRAPLKEATFKRGTGDRVNLKIVKGVADFDDIEFIVQRDSNKGVLYAFNQPEPDWWREPAENWVDHGGIACVLASSWVSLIAPNSKGMLWNKRTFSSDALVAFNVEENSEWYGWDKYPNHTHFPFDNITVTLANDKDAKTNYTLVVNGERHTSTILYRNEKEVARIRQDGSFPMRYIGSHMPFLPRVNRVSLIKRAGAIRGIVNGKEVIAFDDPAPLDVSKVGIGGQNTRINFSHVEIRDLASDSPTPPTTGANNAK